MHVKTAHYNNETEVQDCHHQRRPKGPALPHIVRQFSA